MKNFRLKRINKLLKVELSLLIQKEFPQKFTTIQRVETAPDLKTAKIWLSFLNLQKNQAQKLVSEIQKKARYFQNILAKKYHLKFIPKLEFIYDLSPEIADRIDQILAQDKKSSKNQ